MPEGLTPAQQGLIQKEHDLVEKLASLVKDFSDVMAPFEPKEPFTPNNRANDMHEVVLHIHALQNMVLAQAAGRMYPNMYRLMGSVQRRTDIGHE